MCLEVGFAYTEKVTNYMGNKECFIISKKKVQAIQCEIQLSEVGCYSAHL